MYLKRKFAKNSKNTDCFVDYTLEMQKRNHNRWIEYKKKEYIKKLNDKLFDDVDEEENILVEETINHGGTFTLKEINQMSDRFKEKLIKKIIEVDRETRSHVEKVAAKVSDERDEIDNAKKEISSDIGHLDQMM